MSPRLRWLAAPLAVAALTGCGASGGNEPAADAATAPPAPAASTGPVVIRVSVGPGAASTTAVQGAFRLKVALTPNRVGKPLAIVATLTEDGAASDATIDLTAAMLDMQMARPPVEVGSLKHGVLRARWSGIGMAGRYGLAFTVTPTDAEPFVVVLVDTVG
jgi:hypothetical protein